MCWSKNSKTLSWLGVVWGLLSLATLLTAFLSNVWLYTKEPIRFPNNDILTTVTFKIGLWRICPTFKRTNGTPYVPNPSCTYIRYSSWDDITAGDIGISSPLEFTPSFLSRMRISTPFGVTAMVFILLATGFALAGLYSSDHKTLVACGLYMLGGLTLGGGLLIFASVLSDAYFERPRRSHVIGEAFEKLSSSTLFDYKYGWSFFAAGAAFFMSELAAVLSISAYVRRFPTVEEMVRLTVPGAERRLKERHGLAGEYLVQHQNKYQRHEPDASGSLTSGLSTKCYPKGEDLNEAEIEGIESSILFTKPAPDICSSNPGVTTEDILAFSNPPLVSPSLIGGQEGSYCLQASEPPYILDESTSFSVGSSQVNLTSSLAGQTVPIVLMSNGQRSNGPSSFGYATVKPKEKGSFKSSAIKSSGEATSCCLNKSAELRHNSTANTLPSRRFRHCVPPNASTLDRGRMNSAEIDDGCGTRRFEYVNPDMDPTLAAAAATSATLFETFHSEGTFIPPGILRNSLDVPGTSSTTSSSSGGTGSGMTMTTGSSVSSSSRTNHPQVSGPEKKKKKVVTIGNVFSTMDTFESSLQESELFDAGSVV